MFKQLRVSVLAALCLALIPALAPAQTPESEASYLPPAEWPPLQPMQGVAQPTVAFGLSRVADWVPISPFINVMRTMRVWQAAAPGNWNAMTEADLRDQGFLDENGWVTRMPSGINRVIGLFAWGDIGADIRDTRAGRYVLTYEGTGSVRVRGNPQEVTSNPGEIVFDVPELAGNWWFEIREIEPDNYIRNIKIFREEHRPLVEAGEIFNPDWVALIEDSRQIRFMDMMETNNSEDVTWDEFTKSSYYTWSKEVPVDVQVQLANKVQADPWFNIPHLVDDDYVTRFAAYVAEHLDPSLRAYVEFSNETWNWQFSQTRDLSDIGRELWGNDQRGIYYTKRAAEVMAIFTEAFGGSAEDRLVRVLAGQNGNAFIGRIITTGDLWSDLDPDNFVPIGEAFDAWAVTTYFGGSLGRSDRTELRNTVLSLPPAEGYQAMADALMDESVYGNRSIPGVLNSLIEQRDLAHAQGLRFLLYEGGQHHHESEAGFGSDQAYQAFMRGFVRSQPMADLYAALWDVWEQVGEGPFMQFIEVSRPGNSGSWGLRINEGDQPPRASFLDNANATVSPWWPVVPGSDYRHGLTFVDAAANSGRIAGTDGDDTLAAGDGDDYIRPGGGRDLVHGGAGIDVMLLEGNAADWSLEHDSDSCTYRFGGQTKTFRAIERVQFADGDLQKTDGC